MHTHGSRHQRLQQLINVDARGITQVNVRARGYYPIHVFHETCAHSRSDAALLLCRCCARRYFFFLAGHALVSGSNIAMTKMDDTLEKSDCDVKRSHAVPFLIGKHTHLFAIPAKILAILAQ